MRITRQRGIAGQYSVTAETLDGPLTFISSEYGGPVVMRTPGGLETFVSDPGRFAARHGFGPVLSVEWVENPAGASRPSSWQPSAPAHALSWA